MVVDLPAPFGPRNPVTSPGSTRNDRPSTATVAPYFFVRLLASIMSFSAPLVDASNSISPAGRAESPRGRGSDATNVVMSRRAALLSDGHPSLCAASGVSYSGGHGWSSWVAGSAAPTRSARDVATAVVTAVAGIVLTVARPPAFEHLPGMNLGALVGVQLLSAASLLRRRTAPMTVAVVNAGLSIVAPVPAAAVATYGVFAYTRHRVWPWAVTLIVVVVTARPWQLQVSRADDVVNVRLQLMFIAVLVAAALGVGNRRVQAREALLARQREQLADQVRVEERTRLAGEMHDVVTHRVSLMVLQARGAAGQCHR